ncbi:MAG: hypothetical protein GYA14_11095 [Ignavibacteria bacterium]|nr:hypothetical protein [Ignavibacteria bacterium]
MSKLRFAIVAILFSFIGGCQEDDTASNSEKNKLMVQEIWEISSDTEVGQIGAQLRFYEDGRAQVRESATSNWYATYLTWSLSDDGEYLTMNGTDGPGTMDKLQILELTSSLFRGKIVSSTSTSAIGKISKMFKAVQ